MANATTEKSRDVSDILQQSKHVFIKSTYNKAFAQLIYLDTDAQKYQFCLYARDNKKTRPQYVNWIEEKWGVRIDESTVTRILKTNRTKKASS